MKKLLIVLIGLLFLVRYGNNPNLDLTVFVDSLGIDYDLETKEYTLYYHIATSDTLLTTELGANSVDSRYSIAKISSDNLYDAIKILTENSVRNVLINHIQSVILTKDFINYENLQYFDDIVKTYSEISPNFYIFVTESKLDDVYTIKNPDNISSFFSIITSNNYITTYNLIYYTEFVQALHEETLLLKLTMISSTDKIWKDENGNFTTLYISGEIMIQNDGTYIILDSETYKGLELMNHEYISTIVFEGIHFAIHELSIKIKEKNNVFTFVMSGNVISSSINSDKDALKVFEDNVINEYNKILEIGIENNIDIFNFQDILYRKYNKKGQIDLQNVHVKYKLNFKLMN